MVKEFNKEKEKQMIVIYLLIGILYTIYVCTRYHEEIEQELINYNRRPNVIVLTYLIFVLLCMLFYPLILIASISYKGDK